MQDKLLRGDLLLEEWQSNKVYQFLSLLQTKDRELTTSCFEPINEEEWKNVALKAKKRSASSIFSNKTYVVYKFTLESTRMMKIIVKYYNIIIKQHYYPRR